MDQFLTPCPSCGIPFDVRFTDTVPTSSGRCPSCSGWLSPYEKTEGVNEPVKSSKFKSLLSSASEIDANGPLPEALLEDLPPEARELLSPKPVEPEKSTSELRPDIERSLRDQGYVLEEDAHGIRIGGDLINRGPGTGRLSPHDVIRLASQLESGQTGDTKKKPCPECEALSPGDAASCQWCGAPLESER